MHIAPAPSWRQFSSAFKSAHSELALGYESYFKTGGPIPYPESWLNLVQLVSDRALSEERFEKVIRETKFTDAERSFVQCLFWEPRLGQELQQPILRGLDHALYWHLHPTDLGWHPDRARLGGFGAIEVFMTEPFCNPSFGGWRSPWLFENSASLSAEADASDWAEASSASTVDEMARYVPVIHRRLTKFIPPRRESGFFEPYEVAWRTLRDNYLAWLPTAPVWHQTYHEWAQDRAIRSASWAYDKDDWKHDDPGPAEDFVARVGHHRRAVAAEEACAVATDVFDRLGFLTGVEGPMTGRADMWVSPRWVEEVGAGESAARFLLRTNSDFVDSDTARIDIEVVVVNATQEKTLVVWIPRPHGAYDRMGRSRDFNLNLRMALREMDDRLDGDTRGSLDMRKWRGAPILKCYPFHNYRYAPSPAGHRPHVMNR